VKLRQDPQLHGTQGRQQVVENVCMICSWAAAIITYSYTGKFNQTSDLPRRHDIIKLLRTIYISYMHRFFKLFQSINKETVCEKDFQFFMSCGYHVCLCTHGIWSNH